MDLMSFVRQAMFNSVMREIYGSKNLPQTETGMRELEHKFVKYSEGLENLMQPPEFLFRLVQQHYGNCYLEFIFKFTCHV